MSIDTMPEAITEPTSRRRPVPAAAPPIPPRRQRRSGKAWRARFVVLLMLAGAAYGGSQVYEARTGDLAKFDIGEVTLTAVPVPVEALRTGQVTAISTHAQQHVTAGEELGRMITTSTSVTGKVVRTTVPLTAPAAGIVTDDPLPVGTTLQPGRPFAQMYDPADLTFEADVRVADLPKLSPGMSVRLSAPGLPQDIDAVLQRVVPRVGDGSNDVQPDHLRVVLTPRNPAAVTKLVPGLRFNGTVDTASVPERGRPALYTTR